MPHLLNPAGLLALLALAAPLLLHLWRPPARTVRLGSLRFLETGAPLRRQLRWRERALLFVRLGLLTLLALLLARPHWRARPLAGPQRWVLLSPDAAPAGGSLLRFNALRSAGYEVRQLAPGFPLLTNGSPAAAGPESSPPPDVWSLLREADARLPAGSALAVFAPGRLAALRGARPALRRCRVEWEQTPAGAGEATRSWIESLRQDREGARLLATVGTSDAALTRWSRVETPVGGRQATGSEPGAEFSIEIVPAAGGDGVSARLSGGAWTPARVENALQVKVFHGPDRAGDARCVAAAVRAAAQAARRAVNVLVRPGVTLTAVPGAAEADWVFWLDSGPLPETITRAVGERGSGLVSEAGSEMVATASWIIGPGAEVFDAGAVRLWRRTPRARGDAGAALWTDGFGEPLLTETRLGKGRQFRFYSRFHPGWNPLAESTALPAALRSVLFADAAGAPEPDRAHDRRLASPEQCQPAEAGAAGSADPEMSLPPADTGGGDLHGGCWALAALLFGLERAWSLQRRPGSRNAAAEPPLATATRG